jgi:hypothetical protein
LRDDTPASSLGYATSNFTSSTRSGVSLDTFLRLTLAPVVLVGYARSPWRGIDYGARARGLLDRANANRTVDQHKHIDQLLLLSQLHRMMSTVQTPRRIPNIQFRVLVLGRANAGKTSILQRVCDTTESPTIYRRGKDGEEEEVRGPHFVCESDLSANQFKLEPTMDVSDNCTQASLRLPIDIVPARRAHH